MNVIRFCKHVHFSTNNGYQFFQSHFKGDNITVSDVKNRVDMLWEEFGIPLWVTEFTWSTEGVVEDPNHNIHAEQLENYYRHFLIFILYTFKANLICEPKKI